MTFFPAIPEQVALRLSNCICVRPSSISVLNVRSEVEIKPALMYKFHNQQNLGGLKRLTQIRRSLPDGSLEKDKKSENPVQVHGLPKNALPF